MMELDIFEVNALIISLIAIINFPLIVKKRKDFIKYLPGIASLIMLFIFGFLDDLFLLDIFQFLESICILAGAILLLMATLIEFKEIYLKTKVSRTKRNTNK